MYVSHSWIRDRIIITFTITLRNMAPMKLVRSLFLFSWFFVFVGCNTPDLPAEGVAASTTDLSATLDEASGSIKIFRQGEAEPIVTQHAAPDHRPYLHPIAAPDGKGVFTEYSPGHHKTKQAFTGDLHA